MKQIKKSYAYKLLILLSLIALVLTLASCSSSSDSKDFIANENISDSVESAPSVAPMPEYGEESLGFTSQVKDGDAYQTEQKIIYNGNIYIEVNEIKEATDSVEKAIKAAGGFLLNSNKSENDRQYYARYEYKVPVDGLNPLIEEINNMSIGKITNQYINGNDVTEEYLDINSRLKAKRVYEERLLDLFAQASVTDDLLKISNDLSNVQEEIEQLEGRQKYLSYHSANSTLVIEMQQSKNKAGPTASSWEKSIEGFKLSLDYIKDFTIAIFIWTVSSLPILILVFVIVIAVWLVARKGIKRKKKVINYDNKEQEDLNKNNK